MSRRAVFKHISWINCIPRHSIKNLNEWIWKRTDQNERVIGDNLAPGANFLKYTVWQTLFSWQHSSNFHWDCKMAACSNVTKTLQQEVVQIKAKGMTLSVMAREVSHSKSVISRTLQIYSDNNSFKSPRKAGRPLKTNAQDDRIMQRLSLGNRFNTAAGIACQFLAEQGKDLSRHI